MIKLLEKRPILTIIAVVGFMLLPFLDVLEVTIMEARNFISAREMLTDDNWILTTINGEPRYQKPPLPTWITAISASIFGVKSVWGMRFPAVLMVMLLGSMVYTLSRKLELSLRHSFINGLVSVTSLYVVLIIFEGPWDIFAHAFMLTGIYFVFKSLKSQHLTGMRLDWLIASLFIGASILSKGPVSLYVLFLPFVIAYLVVYREQTHRKKWLLFAGMLILGILIGFSWYAYVRYADAETFSRITAKETGNWTSYNVRPFYYYWSFFVQSGLWAIPAFISLLYPYLKTRVSNLKAYRFTLLWTFFAVVLLSVIPEKKSRYLMPVLIPLAMNIGFYLEYLVRRFMELKDKRETVPVYFNFGLIALCFCIAPLMFLELYITDDVVRRIDFPVLAYVLLVALFIISLWLFKVLLKRKIYESIILLIIGVTIPIYYFGSIRSELIPNYEYTDFTYFRTLEKLPLYGLNDATPEMVWEYGDKIPRICRNNVIELPKENRFYVLNFYNDFKSRDDLLRDYNLEFIQEIDLNASISNDGTTRRMATLYQAVKKN